MLKHTPPPYELIFLDVGSLDGTAEFLSGLEMGLSGRTRVHIERAATDLELADACERAFKEARGEFIVLLNNDTIVTANWLNQLLGLVSYSMTMGMVGPMSNVAKPPQLVEVVPYRSSSHPGIGHGDAMVEVSEIEEFAAELHKDKKGNWVHTDWLGGFCLLLKREVLDKIAPEMREWSDLSLFDTDILSVKAKQAGYSLAVCRDLFVHHFGTRTFVHGPAKTGHEA